MAKRAPTWRSRLTGENLLQMFSNESTICVFDTETTGLNNETDKIIQISGIKLDTVTLNEVSRIDMYINPGFLLSPKITELTGITDELLADKPTEGEAFVEIHAFFGDSPAVAAYNTPFDEGFMKHLYARNGKTFCPNAKCDVLEMSRDLVEKGKTENYKLGTIAHHYGVDEGLSFHNSMDDVTATVRLLKIFKGEYEERLSIEETADLVVPDTIISIRYWEGFRGYSRLYINTDIGTFYFDIRSKVWGVKPDTPYSLDEVDMEALRTLAYKFAGVDNEPDFARFKGRG